MILRLILWMSQQLACSRKANIMMKTMNADKSWHKRCLKYLRPIPNSSVSLVSMWETNFTSARHPTTLPLFALSTRRPSHSLRSTSTRLSSFPMIYLRPANSLKFFTSSLQRNSQIFICITISTKMYDPSSLSEMFSRDVFDRNS